MLNVNQITSMLAKLPDPALQKYAQMHRGDPYMLSLTVAESNRRKQMREQAQANTAVAQGRPESVVDQKIAELAAPQALPEEQGIARIPAGDMNFAGGGIVAFAEGGDIPRYQVGGMLASHPPLSVEQLSRLYQVDPALARQAALRAGPAGARLLEQAIRLLPSANVAGYTGLGGAMASDFAANVLANARPEQREDFYSSPMLGAMSGDAGLAAAILNRGETPRAKKIAAEQMQAERERNMAAVANEGYTRGDPRTAGMVFPSGAQQLALAAEGKDVLSSPATKQEPAPTGESAKVSTRTSASTAGGAGIAALDPMQMLTKTEAELGKQADPALAQLNESGRLRKELAEEGASGLETIQKKYDDIYKGKRERLDKREGEIAKMKNEGLGMALLQAGAAMMTTPGNVGAAIGRGIDVGSKQYGAGIQRLRDAQEKLADARDRLEEAEATRGEGSARELLKARQGIKAAGIETSEAMIKHLMDTRKINRETAVQLVKAQLEMINAEKNRATQLQAASISAAARGREGIEQQVFADLVAKHKGDRAAAYQELVSAKREPMTRETAMKEWMDPAKSAMIRAQYPNIKTFEDFWTVMSGGAGAGGGFKVVGVK